MFQEYDEIGMTLVDIVPINAVKFHHHHYDAENGEHTNIWLMADGTYKDTYVLEWDFFGRTTD